MTYLTVTQCKRLKALGFPQNTHQCWSDYYEPGVQFLVRNVDYTVYVNNLTAYALPTVEDLLDWIGGPLQLQSVPTTPGSSTLRWAAIFHPGQEDERKAASAASAIKAAYNLAVLLKKA